MAILHFQFVLKMMKTGKMNFFAGLSHTDVCTETEELEDEEDLEIDVDAPPLKVKKLSDAIQCLEDVQSYLDRHGYIGEATSIASAIDEVA